MTFWKWSKTAANNATADSTCPFPEGMAPSAVDDGIRALMAAAAKYRDDISGAIVTSGTVPIYTLSSNQGFTSAAAMNGAMIAFTPHATNNGACQLVVDGLASMLRLAPGQDLPSNTIIQGTPYVATYNGSTSEWILQGMNGSPYNIPLLGGIDYWGTTTPNSSFIFPVGQAISRTTYASAFGIMGTTFGAGDGSTTFNVPDKRGRVSAAVDSMGGASAGRFSPAFGTAIGEQNHTLSAAELPPHTHGYSGTTSGDSPDHAHGYTGLTGNTTTPGGGYQAGGIATNLSTGGASARHAHTFGGSTDGGAGVNGAAHNVTQPTIVCNYIMRII